MALLNNNHNDFDNDLIDITPEDNSSSDNTNSFYFSIPKSIKGGWNPNYTKDDVVVVCTEGGIGDNVCHLPMIYQVRQMHPDSKLVVFPSHHEVFLNIPYIDEVWNQPSQNDLDGSPFDLYLKDRSRPLYRAQSLYGYLDFSTHIDKRHISEIICDLARVPFPGKDKMELVLSNQELNRGMRILESFRPFTHIIIIQTNGSNYNLPTENPNLNKDWFVDKWEELLVNLAVKYNPENHIFKFLHVGLPSEQPLFNTDNLNNYRFVLNNNNGSTYYNLLGAYDLRTIFSLVALSDGFINIDSLLNHVGYGFRTKGVVLFGRTDPNIFGHEDFHLNVINSKACSDLHCQRAKGSAGDINLVDGKPVMWTCPHRNCMREISPYSVTSVVLDMLDYNHQNPNKYKQEYLKAIMPQSP